MPEGNKTNIFPEDVQQLVFDIATQLDTPSIEKLISDLQWVVVGRTRPPRATPPSGCTPVIPRQGWWKAELG